MTAVICVVNWRIQDVMFPKRSYLRAGSEWASDALEYLEALSLNVVVTSLSAVLSQGAAEQLMLGDRAKVPKQFE